MRKAILLQLVGSQFNWLFIFKTLIPVFLANRLLVVENRF